MIKQKLPRHEADRIRELYRYHILDTKADAQLNNLVSLAAAICETPYALLSFVDTDYNSIQSSFGLNLTRLPRDTSFCAHTILQSGVFMVPDSTQDGRFTQNPLVSGYPQVRFYAGAPLETPTGDAIGTLCVMANSPRELSASQKISLQTIARQVVTHLELHYRLACEAQEKKSLAVHNELEFKTVFENLPHGIAKLDSNLRFLEANLAFVKLLGYSKAELSKMSEFDVTHLEDLLPLSDAARRLRDPEFKLSKFRKRYIAKDGTVVWAEVSGIPVANDEHNGHCILLAIEDIGAVKALETEAQQIQVSLEKARLLASEKSEQLENLFDNMNEGVLLQDASARIVQFNRAATEILGLSQDELTGLTSLDPRWKVRKPDGNGLVDDEHPAIVALKTGKPQLQIPLVVAKSEDHVSHVTINAIPLFRSGHEKPHSVLCTFSDLTQLQATKIELENTLKVIPAGLYRTDNKGHCTYVNANWCELSGQTAEQAMKSGWMGQLHPDDRARVAKEWESSVQEGRAFESVYRLLRPDGTVTHVQASAATVSDVGGLPGGYLRSIQDITSLREAEILNAFYKTSLDTAAIVAFTDSKGKITYANDMFCEISGYSREELIGSKHRLVRSDRAGQDSFKELWEGPADPQKWHGEICSRSKDGTDYWVATTVVPVIGADGKPERYMSLGRDVTHEKRQRQELAEAYQKAEHATKAKSDFLSTMSHEIRTPLNGVIGMTSILQETELSLEQAECVDAISSSGKILLSIINDILDFSKIEAGKVDLEQIEFNFGSYLKELIKPLQYPAHKKGITLSYECSDYGQCVLGDDGKIGQVITNLVSNAIKFTTKGGVSIRVKLEAQGDHTAISVGVHDSGIGIPEEALGRMFQAFSQAEKSTTRKFGGTGLGLSISKKLIEMMGGKITLHSEYGKGTTFSVELCLKTGRKIESVTLDEFHNDDQAPSAKPRPSLLGRVLVAEDNTTNQKVVARMLEKFGCKYHIVANGSEVLDVMRDTRFDLILMDCQMPEMDGYTAARLIRQSDSLPRTTPIVALTANAVSGDETLCVQAGMDGYLTKPVNMKELEVVLTKYLKIRAPGRVAA